MQLRAIQCDTRSHSQLFGTDFVTELVIPLITPIVTKATGNGCEEA
jgi:hypothetical protein